MTPTWLHWTPVFPHPQDAQNGLFVADELRSVPNVHHRVIHLCPSDRTGTAELPEGPWSGVRADSPGGWAGMRWKTALAFSVRGPIEVLILHLPNPDAWPMVLWAKSRGIPVVIREHRSAWFRRFSEKSGLYRWALIRLFQVADGIAVPSEALAREIKKAGIRRPLAVLGNPLPVPVRTPRIPYSGGHRFAHLGDSIGTTKGQEPLIQAFIQHRMRHPKDALEIWGNGPDRAAWEARYGQEPGIHFRDGVPREAVLKAFQSWDTLVVNSPVETFGLAAAEALDRGCTVLSTKNGGVDEWARSAAPVFIRSGRWDDIEDLQQGLEFMRSDRGPKPWTSSEADAFFASLRPARWGADWQTWIVGLKKA